MAWHRRQHPFERGRQLEVRYTRDGPCPTWQVVDLDLPAEEQVTACRDSEARALRQARRVARKSPNGGSIAVYDESGECKSTFVIRPARAQFRLLYNEAPIFGWTISVLAIIVTGASTVALTNGQGRENTDLCNKGCPTRLDSIEKTIRDLLDDHSELLLIPSSLLIVASATVIVTVAVNQHAKWILRRSIIVESMNMLFMALVAIIGVLLYRIPPADSGWTSLGDVVGSMALGAIVLSIWGVGHVAQLLYFYALDTLSDKDRK